MWNQINLSKGEINMNYAKIMENGTVRISSIKKEGYKPLKEEKGSVTLSLSAIQKQKRM